ncbi:MAG: hypothetical protein ACREEW_05030 [Caulobacteraceae bacterium]
MKNVTISMDEETAAWARVEAARAGKSLSCWVGEQLAKLKGGASDFETDLVAVLATPLSAMSEGGRIFERDAIYDRTVTKRAR